MPRTRFFCIAVGLLALIGAILWLDRPPALTKQTRSADNTYKNRSVNSVSSVVKQVLFRRDADFWPQQAQPIRLHHRTLWPTRSLPTREAEARRVGIWLVQFGGPLAKTEITELKRLGLEVLFPTVACAFHVRTSPAALQRAENEFVPKILGWARLEPADKLLLALRTRAETASEVRVELYPHADEAAVRAGLAQAKATVLRAGNGWFEVRGPAGVGLALAALEDIYAVDLPQPRKQVCNVQAATASNIAPCQIAPRNLSGSGIVVMVRDEGKFFSHPDLNGRITFAPDAAALGADDLHSTHVAGTIGGTGSINAAAKGMATACSLVNYDMAGDDVNEPLQARSSYGAVISNHAYGFAVGWNGGSFIDNQATFGTYSTFARNWDSIIQSDSLIMVKAVGNDRNDSGSGQPHDGTLASDGEYYDCVDSSATGKNIVCVGAAGDAAQAGVPSTLQMVTSGSSSGPCDDGRLRPEIVVNGESVFSCNNSAAVGSEYTTLTGSSMACAAASGATALLMQRYQQRFGPGAHCTPHFLRALLAQTATDLGRSGPDYLHGFGMLDLTAALDVFDLDNGSNTRLVNGDVSATTPERFFSLNSDGVTPIKATLCWTDAPGDVLAAKALINDLDLRLIRTSDQSVFYPFRLNPAVPAQAAATGVNSVDTIEQVVFAAPSSGLYLLAVRGTTLSSSTFFTLASSHSLVQDIAPIARINSTATSGAPPLLVTFDATGSTDYDGSIVRYAWDFGDGTTSDLPSVQHVYSEGSYLARLTVFDDLGASGTASVYVGVANQPPTVVLSASPESGPPPLVVFFSSDGSLDPDGSIVDYQWDFGNGATASGPSASTTYTAGGLYFVTLTVTDSGGAKVARTGVVLAGQSLIPASGSFSLKFNKVASDRFKLYSKALPLDPVLDPAGLTGRVQVGTGSYKFTLDAKGNFRSSPLNIKFVPDKGQLRVTLSRAALDKALAGTGATNRDTTKESIRVPFAFCLDNGTIYGSAGLNFSYSAKRAKSGTGKLVAP